MSGSRATHRRPIQNPSAFHPSPKRSSPASLREVEIIGAAIGCGARDPRCEYGPDILRDWGLAARLAGLGCNAHWGSQLYPHYGARRTEPEAIVSDFATRLMLAVAASRLRGKFPLVVGGDHSCGIGTWSGMHRVLWRQGPLGLVWIDAHMDSHTPETTPSGALHGMPVATLLGYGDPRLVKLGGIQVKLAPRQVCLVGVRSFERGEAALLARLGVRVIFADEVRRRGMRDVLAEAIAIAQAGTVGFGVSIDLDAIDPEDAPAVGSPVKAGIRGADLVDALGMLRGNPCLLAMEIAEYIPVLDPSRKTAELVLKIAGAVIASSVACLAA